MIIWVSMENYKMGQSLWISYSDLSRRITLIPESLRRDNIEVAIDMAANFNIKEEASIARSSSRNAMVHIDWRESCIGKYISHNQNYILHFFDILFFRSQKLIVSCGCIHGLKSINKDALKKQKQLLKSSDIRQLLLFPMVEFQFSVSLHIHMNSLKKDYWEL